MLSGELAAFVIICRIALRAPEAVGSKEIVSVQFALAARLLPQLLAIIGKSPTFAPENVSPDILRAASPVLVNVTVCGIEVVPRSRAAKVSDELDNEIAPSP